MLDQTDAFKILKTEQQRILDFSKLVCYAVPNLKKAIKGYNEKIPNYESFVKPEYFIEPLVVDQLSELSKHYKDNLSKYVLISAFSFFESYFRDVVRELHDFHGGIEKLVKHVQERQNNLLSSQSADMTTKKRVLKTKYKKVRWQKYKKAINDLESERTYRNPSELFSAFGIKSFFETVMSNGFKSVMIPELLETGIGLDLSEKINKHPELIEKNLKETFNTMRDLRNSIGHGKANSISFDKVMDLIRFLRFFAVKIDTHLVDNYFVIENYK